MAVPPRKCMADQHAAWQARLPEDETSLLDRLLAQDDGTVTGLIAYWAANTNEKRPANSPPLFRLP
jgi:hypothetical protein